MAGWGTFQWIAASGMAATAAGCLCALDMCAYLILRSELPRVPPWPPRAKWIEWRERRKQGDGE